MVGFTHPTGSRAMSQQINLLNPDLRIHWKLTAAWMGWGLAAALVVVIATFGILRYQVNVLSAEAARSEQKLKAESERLTKLAAEAGQRQSSKLLEEEVRRMEALLASRQEVMETLRSGALGNTDGYSDYLRAFARQSLSGLWLTGFSITGAGHALAISGRILQAELVPTYIRRLNQEPALKGKQFDALAMSQPETPAKEAPAGYLEFSLQSGDTGPAPAKPFALAKPATP